MLLVMNLNSSMWLSMSSTFWLPWFYPTLFLTTDQHLIPILLSQDPHWPLHHIMLFFLLKVTFISDFGYCTLQTIFDQIPPN